MSENTNIEWCDSTFNSWIGCQAVGPGCDNCYANKWVERFGKDFSVRTRTSTANWRKPLAWNNEPFYQCACGWRGAEKDLDIQTGGVFVGMSACPVCDCVDMKPARRRVFCASLADVFDNQVDPQWRADLFALIAATPNLDWLLLTKRIGNVLPMLEEACKNIEALPDWNEDGSHAMEGLRNWLADWIVLNKVPANVWVGATIVNQEEADRDIPKLLSVPAAKRFLSMEPLLGPVDLSQWLDIIQFEDGAPWGRRNIGHLHDMLDWVIDGGESGPGARPKHPDWSRSLRDQCAAAGIPYFHKQWGEWFPTGSADFCRSPTAPEHAKFREKYGRGGYEFPHAEGRSILLNGRTCLIDPPGTTYKRPGSHISDIEAMKAFRAYCQGGPDPKYQWMYKIGKKAAGRKLDGVEHNGFPE